MQMQLGSCQSTYLAAILAVYIAAKDRIIYANLSHLSVDKGEYHYYRVLSRDSQSLQSDVMSIHVVLAGVTDRHRTMACSRVL